MIEAATVRTVLILVNIGNVDATERVGYPARDGSVRKNAVDNEDGKQRPEYAEAKSAPATD